MLEVAIFDSATSNEETDGKLRDILICILTVSWYFLGRSYKFATELKSCKWTKLRFVRAKSDSCQILAEGHGCHACTPPPLRRVSLVSSGNSLLKKPQNLRAIG